MPQQPFLSLSSVSEDYKLKWRRIAELAESLIPDLAFGLYIDTDCGMELIFQSNGYNTLSTPFDCQLVAQHLSAPDLSLHLREGFNQFLSIKIRCPDRNQVGIMLCTRTSKAEFNSAEQQKITNIALLYESDLGQLHTACMLEDIKQEKAIVLDNIPAMVASFDRKYRYLSANRAYLRAFNLEHIGELAGKHIAEIIGEDNWLAIQPKLKKVISGKKVDFSIKMSFPTSERFVDVAYVPQTSSDGPVERFFALITDVHLKRLTEDKLRFSERRFALAAKGLASGIWEWDAESKNMQFSDNWFELTGVPNSSDFNKLNHWIALIHQQDRSSFEHKVNQAICGLTDEIDCEIRMSSKSEQPYWFRCHGATEHKQGKVIRIAGSLEDIHQKKMAQSKLEFDAAHDAMTGLPNRHHFNKILAQSLSNHPLLLFIDLDKFKQVNDRYGHACGDELLVTIAKRIQENVRPGDTVCRYGGDEFVVLMLNYLDREEAISLTKRLLRSIGQMIQIGPHPILISASIGMAFYQSSYKDPQQMLQDADMAMYQAKEMGSGNYFVFDQGLGQFSKRRQEMETDIQHALAKDEFELFYQPIMDLQTQQIIGCEGLIRWQHPTKGTIDAKEFVPVAEKAGMIAALDEKMLKIGLTQFSRTDLGLREDDAFRLSINCSCAHLMQSDLLINMIKMRHADSLKLNLELTETTLIDNTEYASYVIEGMRAVGVSFAIDDFGTGYSSLAYLQHFSVDSLKIDQQFVSKMLSDISSLNIINAVINLAKAMNLKVVAEGVVNKDQADKLLAMGCDSAQGHYFYPALSASEFARIMQRQNLH